GLIERLVAPRSLLAGAVCSFVACCLLGALASRHNPYRAFERFHTFMSIQTLHYPTASQVCALGRDGLPPDQVLVVLGGNSILYGTGQRIEEVWSRRLQEELGERFSVLNLAQPGASFSEFACVAAEAIARYHDRVIFVAPFGISAGAPDQVDG